MTPRRGRLHRCRVFLLSGYDFGFWVFADVRVAVFAAQAVWVFGASRWHPRFAFVLHALRFGVLGFALASANC